jgi:hypothetical protein
MTRWGSIFYFTDVWGTTMAGAKQENFTQLAKIDQEVWEVSTLLLPHTPFMLHPCPSQCQVLWAKVA